MIAILGTTSYIHSPLILRLKSGFKINDQPVRAKRSNTLDAGTVLVHSGFSANDKTLTLPCDMTRAEHDILLDMLSNETLFTLSLDGSFYTGAISNVSQGDGISLTFLPADEEHTAAPPVVGGGASANTDWAMASLSSGGYTTFDEAYSDWNAAGGSNIYISLGYSDLRGPRYTGLRFSSASIPAETVETARIKFTSNAYTGNYMAVEIAVQDSTDAENLTGGTEILELDEHPQSTTWYITDSWTSGGTVYTPDFADTLNQALTAAGYTPGNGVMVIFKTKYSDSTPYRSCQTGSSVYLMLNDM